MAVAISSVSEAGDKLRRHAVFKDAMLYRFLSPTRPCLLLLNVRPTLFYFFSIQRPSVNYASDSELLIITQDAMGRYTIL